MNAIIWGASGGIGSALVEVLKHSDWRVFAVARTIENIPESADFNYEFNADDSFSIREACYAIARETQEIDLVVYAVGNLHSGKLHDLDMEAWDSVISSNLTGAYLTAKHSIDLMKRDAHMVFIGAYIDHIILPKMGAYAVAKAGLDPLVAILRKEHRKMRFTVVRPGAVDTAFWDNAPFKKPGNIKPPQEVARAIIDHHMSNSSDDLNLE